jgi:hypothetical protein
LQNRWIHWLTLKLKDNNKYNSLQSNATKFYYSTYWLLVSVISP